MASKTKLCIVNKITHFSDIATEINENQSICTDLTYESAQIKLFSRLLGFYGWKLQKASALSKDFVQSEKALVNFPK